ncbi:MAG: histidine kinase [Deltaproteobacteria bacterium]|nr:histidine kinase [Deltaproteobacteria bacterium]
MSSRASWKMPVAALAMVYALVISPTFAEVLVYGSGPPLSAPLFAFLALVVIVVPVGVFELAERLLRARIAGTNARLAIAYGLAAVAGALFYLATDMPAYLMPDGEYPRGAFTSAFLGAYNGVLVVGVWALAYVLPRAAREARERERERDQLRRAAEHARLRATLEPHFVLNTLNAIAGLVTADPEQARERIGDLGDLLRDAVRLADSSHHTLDDEVRWLERYTRILVSRHDGNLEVRWDVDPASRAASVPVLVLQPIVENAIQHGALQRPDGGRVEIATRVAGDRISCTIADNGPGFPPEPRPGAQGLALTRRRLSAEWPGATLSVASGRDGTRVEIGWESHA